MTNTHPAFHCWLTEPLSPEIQRALRRLQQSNDIQHIAVMPDIHLAHDVCIGTVVATEHLIYPDAVGGDIGCGMTTVQWETDASILSKERSAARLLQGLYSVIPTHKHSQTTAPQTLPDDLIEQELSTSRLEKMKTREGRVQLGTLGRGNHFLEFQEGPNGALWTTIHSGSRAMGQAIRHQALKNASASATGLRFLHSQSPEGKAYLSNMEWALRYASANRAAMLQAVCKIMEQLFAISPAENTWLDCHHNHVCREEHEGRNLWVHRKGANAAQRGKPGIIPGSMGSPSFLVEGKGKSSALCSSSHGAGRTHSRTQARRTITPHSLNQQMKGVWFDQRLEKQLVEEAPSAYKDIRTVMRAQRDLVRITHTLHPILSFKGR